MRRKARAGGGRQVEVLVKSLGAKGDGLAESGGRPLFLPQTVPGDRVRARITGERSGGFKGTVIELLEGGPSRGEAPCPFYGPCGGCALQHLDAVAYGAWKADLLGQALARRGLGAGRLHPLVQIPPGRRRRAVLSARHGGRTLSLGYHERESHRLVDIDACLLLTAPLNQLLQPLREALEAVLDPREEARVTTLDSETGIDLLIESSHELTLEDREGLAAFAAEAALARLSWRHAGETQPLSQHRDPVLRFGETLVVPPPGGFVQPTAEGQEALVERVLAAVPETAETAADLFCGCGTFTFPLARRLQVYAAEADEAAVEALALAARKSDRPDRVSTECRDLARAPVSAEDLSGADVVVFDPPRAGAREQARALAQSDVPRVVAVSCNPTTFARDARTLVDGGYRLIEATPIDQFPWSGHLEVIAVFER